MKKIVCDGIHDNCLIGEFCPDENGKCKYLRIPSSNSEENGHNDRDYKLEEYQRALKYLDTEQRSLKSYIRDLRKEFPLLPDKDLKPLAETQKMLRDIDVERSLIGEEVKRIIYKNIGYCNIMDNNRN